MVTVAVVLSRLALAALFVIVGLATALVLLSAAASLVLAVALLLGLSDLLGLLNRLSFALLLRASSLGPVVSFGRVLIRVILLGTHRLSSL